MSDPMSVLVFCCCERFSHIFLLIGVSIQLFENLFSEFFRQTKFESKLYERLVLRKEHQEYVRSSFEIKSLI